jgi:chromosome segregation ATPase
MEKEIREMEGKEEELAKDINQQEKKLSAMKRMFQRIAAAIRAKKEQLKQFFLRIRDRFLRRKAKQIVTEKSALNVASQRKAEELANLAEQKAKADRELAAVNAEISNNQAAA